MNDNLIKSIRIDCNDYDVLAIQFERKHVDHKLAANIGFFTPKAEKYLKSKFRVRSCLSSRKLEIWVTNIAYKGITFSVTLNSTANAVIQTKVDGNTVSYDSIFEAYDQQQQQLNVQQANN